MNCVHDYQTDRGVSGLMVRNTRHGQGPGSGRENKNATADICESSVIAPLRSFKSFLTDPSNRLSSWQGENCCSWKGIKCSSSGRVVVVNLRNPHPIEVKININKEVVSNSQCTSDFSLKGNKSPLLFTLDHMKHLYLSYNNFVFSKLPAEISNLTKLTYLNLSNAMFQDSIAMQFTNLTSLRSLDLSCANLVPNYSSVSVSLTFPLKLDFGSSLLSFISYGYLSSPNLRWLEGLRHLRYLVLTGVDLSKASESVHWAKPISSLSNLITVVKVDITRHMLHMGRLPLCILQLPKLSSLYIQRNRLNGNMPFSLFRKSRLDEISLGTSGLSAEIDDPDQPFVQTFQPKILEFTSCNMRGKIPDFFSNFTSLVVLNFINNSLSGAIPQWLFNLPVLSILALYWKLLKLLH
ncbi:putative CASP-like protein PIMP1-like [Capsicum annuum]|nr:putative CASP-like protein PIMP1-like [Capsicum annuum]